MTREQLEAFRHVPFLVWVKDAEWRYLWGNDKIAELAGEDVVGKLDGELVWKETAGALVAHDKAVFSSGTAGYMHERVEESLYGNASLSVCKWVEEFDGKPCVFGISFIIPEA
ncbi:MAG: hypothetical protein AAGJ94_18210 [Pseudomonadota bacterium]